MIQRRIFFYRKRQYVYNFFNLSFEDRVAYPLIKLEMNKETGDIS